MPRQTASKVTGARGSLMYQNNNTLRQCFVLFLLPFTFANTKPTVSTQYQLYFDVEYIFPNIDVHHVQPDLIFLEEGTPPIQSGQQARIGNEWRKFISKKYSAMEQHTMTGSIND